MNFYPFHIGDYASHTGHLTELEDLYYRRLIDVYYTREAPIPADVKQACRLVRANTPQSREAVETVLAEFFVAGPDGFRNARCDAEIDRAQDKKRKASQSAAKRWGNADASANAMRSDMPTHMRTHMPTHSEGNAPNPNPNPNPNPKSTAATVVQQPTREAAALLPGLGEGKPENPENTDPPGSDWPPDRTDPADPVPHIAAPTSRVGRVANLLRQAGVRCGPSQVQVHDIASDESITDDVLVQVLVDLNDRQGTGTFGPGLVLLRAREFLKPPKPRQGPAADFPGWRTDDKQADGLGKALGLVPNGGENYTQYRARIAAKLNEIRERAAA